MTNTIEDIGLLIVATAFGWTAQAEFANLLGTIGFGLALGTGMYAGLMVATVVAVVYFGPIELVKWLYHIEVKITRTQRKVEVRSA